MMSFLFRLGAYLLLKRPVKDKTFAEIIDTCRENGRVLVAKISAAPENEANQEQLNHIIGIEQWGQSRLQIALGGPLLQDEYDQYRPEHNATFSELRDLFPTVRATTVALAEKINKNDADNHKVPHNQFGDLDCKVWLYYLTIHADRESHSIN